MATGRLEHPYGIGYKISEISVAGPTSYPAGGFDVVIGNMRNVLNAIPTITGGFLAEVASITDNKVKIKVNRFDYPAAAAGPAVEIPAGTNIAAQTVRLIAFGE